MSDYPYKHPYAEGFADGKDEAKERIAELEAQLAELRVALTSISTALDAYGVRWCRVVAKEALLQETST